MFRGVQTIIREMCPNALYVQCRSLNLNIVVTHSCKSVNPVRNIINNVVQLTWFVCALANRKNIFKGELGKDSDLLEQILEAAEEEDVSGQILQQAASKKVLQPLSETRWTALVDSLSTIITNYSKINESLIKIEDNQKLVVTGKC